MLAVNTALIDVGSGRDFQWGRGLGVGIDWRQRLVGMIMSLVQSYVTEGWQYLHHACNRPGHLEPKKFPKSALFVLRVGRILLVDKFGNDRAEQIIHQILGWDQPDWGDEIIGLKKARKDKVRWKLNIK